MSPLVRQANERNDLSNLMTPVKIKYSAVSNMTCMEYKISVT